MKKYVVSLRGENLLMRVKGEERKFGFRTKRYVEADDSEEAERKALGLIFKDTNLRMNIINRENDPPSIETEDVHEVEKPAEVDYKDVKINYYEE